MSRAVRTFAATIALAACTPDASRAPPPVSPAPPPASFSEEPTALLRFASKRFHVTIPLPDGRAWRIDDHSRPELFALHAGTRSRLRLMTFTDPELTSRQRCEELARARKLVPDGDLRTVEEAVTVGPEAFDTRLWVAIAPRQGGVEGHVFAFGGFLRKCLFFHYVTDVPSVNDEAVLSSRLAIARLRVFGGLQIDSLAEPPRAPPR